MVRVVVRFNGESRLVGTPRGDTSADEPLRRLLVVDACLARFLDVLPPGTVATDLDLVGEVKDNGTVELRVVAAAGAAGNGARAAPPRPQAASAGAAVAAAAAAATATASRCSSSASATTGDWGKSTILDAAIPDSMRCRPWVLGSSDDASVPSAVPPPPIFTADDLERKPGEMMGAWIRHGFVCFTLPPELHHRLEALYDDMADFFSRPTDAKERCVSKRETYLGYARRVHFDKELFQVRVCDPDAGLDTYWPPEEQMEVTSEVKASGAKAGGGGHGGPGGPGGGGGGGGGGGMRPNAKKCWVEMSALSHRFVRLAGLSAGIPSDVLGRLEEEPPATWRGHGGGGSGGGGSGGANGDCGGGSAIGSGGGRDGDRSGSGGIGSGGGSKECGEGSTVGSGSGSSSGGSTTGSVCGSSSGGKGRGGGGTEVTGDSDEGTISSANPAGAASANKDDGQPRSTSTIRGGGKGGRGVSQSNLTMFHYDIAEGFLRESVHCPHHSDVGLVTVIPRCRGRGGLHVFDWSSQLWVDVEAGAPPNMAVAFGGETLARLTNNWVMPCMHEVANIEGGRYSTPFQCLAAPDAVLDSADADPAVVGVCSASSQERVSAAAFVQAVSASRVSSNFPRAGASSVREIARALKPRAS